MPGPFITLMRVPMVTGQVEQPITVNMNRVLYYEDNNRGGSTLVMNIPNSHLLVRETRAQVEQLTEDAELDQHKGKRK